MGAERTATLEEAAPDPPDEPAASAPLRGLAFQIEPQPFPGQGLPTGLDLGRLRIGGGGIDGSALLFQSLLFLGIQQSYRVSEEKTRSRLGKDVLANWGASLRNLDRWSDGGKFFTNYVAHPLQGAVSGRILVQNDPRGRALCFGDDGYWRSRLRAFGFATLYSTQFEIGPVSEATMGLDPNREALVDLVVTPTLGTGMLIGEDAVDRYLMQRIERSADSKNLVRLARSLLTPARSFTNLLRFQRPWQRDDRGLTELREELLAYRASISMQEQRRLAEHFAPRLIFHPDEQYFPCSPLFPLEGAEPAVEPASVCREAQLARLRNAESRAEAYRALPLLERLDRARLYFRAYPIDLDGRQRIVVEYWLYYVYNAYRARWGLLPFGSDLSHPNDLEHIFLILRPAPDRDFGYSIETVIANAHGDSVPNNVLRLADRPTSPPHMRFLVELGSHASAADVDGDGVFTPGVDSSREAKYDWGIRDRASPWLRYSPSSMDPRRSGSAIMLDPELPSEDGSMFMTPSRYRLDHADAIDAQFAALGLTADEREALFQTHVAWIKQLFGRSDGGSSALLRPSEHPDYGNPRRMMHDVGRSERGITVGATMIADSHPLMIGGRYAFVTKPAFTPNVLLDGYAMWIIPDGQLYDFELLGYYNVDATSKIIFGGGLISDSLTFQNTQLDWMAGLELGFGRLRFRTAYRTAGSVNDDSLDFRMFYLIR
ncbi:MAG: hypothetical protein AB1714_14045 [Acidobacteriota bacterium]